MVIPNLASSLVHVLGMQSCEQSAGVFNEPVHDRLMPLPVIQCYSFPAGVQRVPESETVTWTEEVPLGQERGTIAALLALYAVHPLIEASLRMSENYLSYTIRLDTNISHEEMKGLRRAEASKDEKEEVELVANRGSRPNQRHDLVWREVLFSR
jgi:hypothetical protein